MQPHPYQNFHWYPLTSSKTFGLKLAEPTWQNDFNNFFYIFTGGGCILSVSPCWPLHTYPNKGHHLETWTRPKPELGLSTKFISEARFRPENHVYRGCYDMRNCWVTKNIVCRCSCRYTVYHTENSNHLEQNIGIIWHKRGMLVKDNTAEYNVPQDKKKLSTRQL